MKLSNAGWSLRIRQIVRAILLVALVSQSGAAFSSLPAEISLSIQVNKTSYSAQDDVVLALEYKNISAYDVRFLRWGTGLDGRIGDGLLDLRFQGQSLPYAGIIVKRMPPTAADYIILSPGQVVSASVLLSSGFEINLKGEYSLQRDSSGAAQKSPTTITEPAVFRLNEDKPVLLTKRPPAFSECTSQQASQADQALSAAESISRNSADAMRGTPASLRNTAVRYREWFGVYAQNRWDKVQRNFDNIYDATANRTVGLDCSCDDGGIDYQSTYAYVYPNDPYKINLCGAFWRAPLLGTDSKAGTIVHEISHFNVVAVTDDVVYGQSGARSLASSNPNAAITNADSHEYFAENTPFLSMPTSADLAADLIIASTAISESTPGVGQPVTISGVIANQGGAGSSTTSLKLTLQGQSGEPETTQIAVPVIAAGANFNFQLDFDAPSVADEYSVLLCVLAISGESNVNNNCSTLSPILVERSPTIAPIIKLVLDE